MRRFSPKPLPRAVLRAEMEAFARANLPRLRARAVPPCRHPGVTLLMYCFPGEGQPFAPFEFALRQTWDVLGALPTVVVTHRAGTVPEPFARAHALDVQIEPRLRPGDVASMSLDCIARLHRRFRTPHVLIVQEDGWPMRDELDAFLRWDFVGAPSVHPGWRARVADALGLTVLNGGFSLRSRRACRLAAALWRLWPGRTPPPEDRFFARLRHFLRFPSAAVARGFAEDCLDGLLPPEPDANPMGFHRASTFAALFAPQSPLTVVSVVRDAACYRRCVRDNPFLKGARFVVCDNTRDNAPIPVRYNAFLDAMPPDTGWILFAHEDFEVREDPRPLLARRNRLFPHGLIGTRMVAGFLILPFGRISDSDRDGGRPHLNRPPLPYGDLLGDTAENFDCCGFFVHAECFRTFGLRFDPVCAWDLYAEDLCFQFIRATGHRVRILPLRAHHWSLGDATTARFLATRDALNRKYADTLFAGGTCTLAIGGMPPLRIRLLRRLARALLPWRFRRKPAR